MVRRKLIINALIKQLPADDDAACVAGGNDIVVESIKNGGVVNPAERINRACGASAVVERLMQARYQCMRIHAIGRPYLVDDAAHRLALVRNAHQHSDILGQILSEFLCGVKRIHPYCVRANEVDDGLNLGTQFDSTPVTSAISTMTGA